MDFPEPTTPRDDRREVLLEYLDYYRWVVRVKVTGLDDSALRTSRLSSGWTPIELVKHLLNVERRWIVWGFEGVDGVTSARRATGGTTAGRRRWNGSSCT
jgi:hypothetical protein